MADGWSASSSPEPGWRCRWCRAPDGTVVLDLGEQAPSGYLPAPEDPLPDPVARLRMVLCATCGLAQAERTDPADETPGVEPAAMVEQAHRTVGDARGLLRPGGTYRQFPSPHGGDWSGPLLAAGLRDASTEPADVVVDAFGLMHDLDQREAFARRVECLAADGVLLIQYHSLVGDVRRGDWTTLRHGHPAYHSAPVVQEMARACGLLPVGAWEYPLQGGTTVLAFARHGPAATVATELAARERALGATDPSWVGSLSAGVSVAATTLRAYLADAAAAGLVVVGYPAASRTPVLLQCAGIGRDLLRAVGDAAVDKQGRSLPVSRIPVVSPEVLLALRADRVLLFVPDLIDEVRRAYPQVEASGARWVVVDPVPVEVVQPADVLEEDG